LIGAERKVVAQPLRGVRIRIEDFQKRGARNPHQRRGFAGSRGRWPLGFCEQGRFAEQRSRTGDGFRAL
jgi:hypothetical protein